MTWMHRCADGSEAAGRRHECPACAPAVAGGHVGRDLLVHDGEATACPLCAAPVLHEFKSYPEPFRAAHSGAKPYEVRRADRDVRAGDRVLLREWVPDEASPFGGYYTGAAVQADVTHVNAPGTWGLPDTVMVFGIRVTGRAAPAGTWPKPAASETPNETSVDPSEPDHGRAEDNPNRRPTQ